MGRQSAQSNGSEPFDVVVVGGGIGGLSAALALKTASFRSGFA